MHGMVYKKGKFTDSGLGVKEADRNVLDLWKASVRKQGESRAPTDTLWFSTSYLSTGCGSDFPFHSPNPNPSQRPS